MKKEFVFVFFSLLLFGMMFSTPITLAQDTTDEPDIDSSNSGSSDDSDTESDSNSGSSDDSDSLEETDKDRTDKVEEDNSGSGKENRERTEFKREFINEAGQTVKIERKIEIKDGKTRIEIIRKITDAEGNEREIKIKIEEDGERKRIHIEGKEDMDVETELEIETEFKGNDSDLKARLSNGRLADIKVLPDRASDIAVERLRANNFTIELIEIEHNNVPRVVYHIEADKEGRFLGIFKTRVRLENQIDSETGDLLNSNKPWWAFLVSGEGSDQTNEQTSDETEEEEEEIDSNETTQ
ncbi:MAG: hypothetical protein WDZ77_02525 [Candidatus Pacearchaeota archaeon]